MELVQRKAMGQSNCLAEVVSILFAGGLHAQSQIGRRYLEGFAVRNMGVQGPGTDIWMLHSLFDGGECGGGEGHMARVVRL
jgi:hypothetical protein